MWVRVGVGRKDPTHHAHAALYLRAEVKFSIEDDADIISLGNADEEDEDEEEDVVVVAVGLGLGS